MSTPRAYVIYTLNEPNSEIVRYVGITSQPLKERYQAHLRYKEATYRYNWVQSLLKQGLKPDIHIIDTANDLEEAYYKEISYIKLYKSVGARLTNLTMGGKGVNGNKKSAYTRKKLSIGLKGKYTGEKHWWYGRKHSEETKAKMSKASKGRKMSDELRVRLLKINLGKKATAETKAKLSAIRKGRPLARETVEKIRKANIGQKRTPEQIAVFRAVQLGKKASVETRLKMQLAQSGSNGHKALFTPEQVNEIRRLYQNGIKRSYLVKRYGVSKSTIDRIVSHTSYKYQ